MDLLPPFTKGTMQTNEHQPPGSGQVQQSRPLHLLIWHTNPFTCLFLLSVQRTIARTANRFN
jgi:hypothetical protein